MCLLCVLLSVCGVGCGIGKPPVKTLEQWQAEADRVRSRPWSPPDPSTVI
jgi:hypothetical protein